MKQATDRILNRVVCRTNGWEFRDVLFSGEMVRILQAVDGHRSMGDIARILDLPLNALFANTLRLMSLGLVDVSATLSRSPGYLRN
jgi:hypothetical protein